MQKEPLLDFENQSFLNEEETFSSECVSPYFLLLSFRISGMSYDGPSSSERGALSIVGKAVCSCFLYRNPEAQSMPLALKTTRRRD